MRKLRLWFYYFLASFGTPRQKAIAIRTIEYESILEARAKITLTDRSEEKASAYKEWSKPENIALRVREHNERALAALEAGRRMSGRPIDETPIPPDSELPPHIRGQSVSTIRAYLRDPWEVKQF